MSPSAGELKAEGILPGMARTKRQRKLDERRRREFEREIERRRAEGEHLLIGLVGPDTKVRPSIPTLGKPITPESDHAKRLAKARAFLGLPY
jgi:hypothetical protein